MAQLGTLFDEEQQPESRVAFPSRRLSARESLFVRIAIAVGCILATTLLVYLERDDYRDGGTGEPLDLNAALYYATVTLSTTGYGDITPVSDTARLANVFIVTPLRFIFLIVLVSTTVEVLTQAARQRSRVNRWRKRMKDHTVIVGFGVKGQAALRSLLTPTAWIRARSSSSPTIATRSPRPPVRASPVSSGMRAASGSCSTPASRRPRR